MRGLIKVPTDYYKVLPKGKVQILDTEAVPMKIWKQYSDNMKQMGYDIRGGEDAKMLVEKRKKPSEKGKVTLSDENASGFKAALGLKDLHKPKTDNAIIEAAIKEYGFTTNPNVAGYMLQDGRMLDFSGGGSIRGIDHGNITSVIEIPHGSRSPMYKARMKFMDMGNIRVMVTPSTAGFDLNKRPTRKQTEAMEDIIFNGNHNEILIDVNKKSEAFPGGGDSWSDVKRFINKSFGMSKLASKIEKDIIEAKKSKKPSIFLGGECKDGNKWREDIKKEFGDRFFFIDPYDSKWEAEDNIYDELAGLINVDHVIFYKGGSGTKREKKFLENIGENKFKEFSDLDKLMSYVGTISEGAKIKVTTASFLRKAASHLIKIAKHNVEYKFSNTQVELPEDLAKKVIEWGEKNVPDEEVFADPKDPGTGREDEIHVTLFYGVNSPDPDEVSELLKDHKKFEVRLGLVTAFRDGDKNDVLKIDVESPDMQQMHYLIGENIKNGNTYKTYQPHVTIAYMKKGEADKYIGNDTFKGKTFKCAEIIFSSSNGSKTPIKLK